MEREELVSDTLRLRWLSVAAVVIWTAFAIDDWLIGTYIDRRSSVGVLWSIRAAALVPLAAVAVRMNVRRKMTRLAFTLYDIGIFSVIQAALTLMCIQFQGIKSPLITGILVVLISRSSILACHWHRGLLTLGIPLLMFPIILSAAAIFSPEIRGQFLDSQARAVFLRHLFVVSASLGVCVWGGHGNWALRRQLFEARNIGRYRLKRRIGRGGMGEVWVAYHAGLQRDVALKVLRPDDETDPIAVQRFEQEVAATSRLTHPNTVRVFDHGVTDDGIWYYAMELLEGVNLYELVRDIGPMPVDRTLSIAHQVARSLAEAHARGIVHRDVKPENIFVTHAGDEPDFVKVLDFGIAKMRAETRGATLTRTGAVFGTPAYISPEAARGQPTSAHSDVYGVGAVMYFMLTGKPPFLAVNLPEVLIAHMNQPVPPFDSHPGIDVPADIAGLVMRCLSKEADHRYADASELASELSRLIARRVSPLGTTQPAAC